MSKPGILILVSGPSGVGKDTIVDRFLETSGTNCMVSVSATTRLPRPSEKEGKDYFFVTMDQFLADAEQGRFLEHAKYNGNYYGTPIKAVEEQLALGKHVILVIEIQGAQQIRQLRPNALSIFLLPPSFKSLHQRLIGRGTDSTEDIDRRMHKAKEEIELAYTYDYVMINDHIEETVKLFGHIITAAECSPKFVPNLLKGVCSPDA